MNLKQKTAFITGASSGIGAATAEAFARAGANLLLCSRHQEKLLTLAARLEKDYGIQTQTLELDVSQEAEVKQRLEALPEEWKTLDILVNNAGLAAGLDLFQNALLSDWEEMINTNVKGLLYVTRQVLPGMLKRDSGHIVNIGSIAGHEVYPKGAVYCATKAAVRSISQGLRFDLSGSKIRVSSVDPGAVETNFSVVRFKGDEERAASVYVGMEPLRAEDIADTILFCVTRPPHVNVSEILIMPTDQASATVVSRKK